MSHLRLYQPRNFEIIPNTLGKDQRYNLTYSVSWHINCVRKRKFHFFLYVMEIKLMYQCIIKLFH